MASARKLKTTPSDEVQLQLLYGDDSRFKYWESHLFNEVYLRRDLPEKHSDKWERTEDIAFQHFMNTLRNLASEYKDREKELSSWSETETINNWVKYVLDGLGWKNNCTGVQNPFLEETSFRYDGKTYRTDILIVDHPKQKQYVNQAKGDDKLVEARNSVIMPVEVKYWQRLEEFRQGRQEENKRRDIASDDLEKSASPNEQTVQYMDILDKSWGILTDGAKWRLFSSELSSEDSNRYYEFNLFSLVQSMNTEETEADRLETIEAAKYFYHFFSKETLYSPDEGQESFVGEILRYSKKYVNRVEEDLKDRFVKAMNIACNGLYAAAKSEGQTQDLIVIRNVAESTLFNILFIKSLESRGVLPMISTDYRKISLSSIVDKIEKFDPDKEDLLNVRDLERAFKKGNGNSFSFDPKGHDLHERILRLTNVVHDGSTTKDDFGFEISGFRESIFSTEEWQLFKKCKLSNLIWVRILFQLGYADSNSLSRKYQQIPYGYFTARQLGSIYESFLEFQLARADEDLVLLNKMWQKYEAKSKKHNKSDLPKVHKGQLFFTPDNAERKITGSFYTPDYVTKYIVAEAIHSHCESKKPSEILKIKVLDPAMGSGHFLVAAFELLTRKYIAALDAESLSPEIIREAKQSVIKSCIFGVDINPRAVKLAKLSLWLSTAGINQKLENLDDQLYVANTLLDKKWIAKIREIHGFDKFDAVVGNPPYARVQTLNSGSASYVSELQEKFKSARDGSFDLFCPFIELGLSILSLKGKLAFITPNNYLVAEFGRGLRKVVSEGKTLSKLVNLNQFQVFNEASTYTCISIFTNRPNTEVTVSNLKNNDEKIEKIKSFFSYRDLSEEIFSKDVVTHPENDSKWAFAEGDSDSVLIKLNSNTDKFSDHTEKIYQGIATSADKIYVLDLVRKGKKTSHCRCPYDDTDVEVENELLRPFLMGRGTNQYQMPNPTKVIVYPYEARAGKVHLVLPNMLKANYPLAWAHLSKYRKELEAREKGRYRGAEFYQFSRPQNMEEYDKPKLLMRDISLFGQVTLDQTGGIYHTTTVYGILLKSKSKSIDEQAYWMALLNSRLMWFYIKTTGTGLRGGYFRFKTKYIKDFPVKAFDPKNKHVKEIAILSRLIFNRCVEADQIQKNLEKINSHIFALYGLSSTEISTVEKVTGQDFKKSLAKESDEDIADEEVA